MMTYSLEKTLASKKQRIAQLIGIIKAKIKTKKKKEVEQFIPFIKDGAIIFDIGANFGLYAKAFSQINNGSCSVFCFEPVDYSREVLQKTLNSYTNTEIFDFGFSDRVGTFNICLPIKKSGKIRHGLAHLGEEKRNCVIQRAKMTTIDDFCHQRQIRQLDFIKIDIEGAELLALRGAKETLLQHQPTIFCEVNQGHMSRLNLKVSDLFMIVKSLGYTSYLVDNFTLLKTTGYIRDGDYLFINKSTIPKSSNNLAPKSS